MSRRSFLADNDFNEDILQGVARSQPTVQMTRLRDVGLAASNDADILEWAAQRNQIVLSHDVNTMSAAAVERLALGKKLAGLMLVHQRPLAMRAVIESIVLIWSASDTEEWNGQVIFLPY
jgi:predicted nuclease of predicted toxin-antitoxin system